MLTWNTEIQKSKGDLILPDPKETLPILLLLLQLARIRRVGMRERPYFF